MSGLSGFNLTTFRPIVCEVYIEVLSLHKHCNILESLMHQSLETSSKMYHNNTKSTIFTRDDVNEVQSDYITAKKCLVITSLAWPDPIPHPGKGSGIWP